MSDCCQQPLVGAPLQLVFGAVEGRVRAGAGVLEQVGALAHGRHIMDQDLCARDRLRQRLRTTPSTANWCNRLAPSKRSAMVSISASLVLGAVRSTTRAIDSTR